MTIDKSLPGIRKNVLLKNYTTFKIGGPAKYFFIAKTKEDLILAIKWAKENKIPFFNSRAKRGNQSSQRAKRGGVFILGGGSNLLVSDRGFNGLVIKIQSSKFQVQSSKEDIKFICDAGVPLSKLVSESIKYGVTGLEWAVGIPGTVGGAIYGNAGWPSNKKNISSIVESVEILKATSRKLQVISYTNKDCQFGYRESVFKKNKNLIILNAILKLKKGNKKDIKKEIVDIIKKRGKKIPVGFSAGSVFKNPTPEQCLVRGKFRPLLAGALIEKCGLKGKKIGNAKISEKHANFIINLGNAKAKDVKSLINLAKKEVKNKFHIELREEIQYLPPKF
jgi:UDP-N-acetylmuramate dehydrogenase